jgi:hypothetical protein
MTEALAQTTLTPPDPLSIYDDRGMMAACWTRQRGSVVQPNEWPCIEAIVRALPPLDPKNRDQFGVYYDPESYLKCKRRVKEWGDTSCGHFILRRRPQPEYWPDPALPKPKLPEPLDPPVYREGMSSREYFAALCAKEAGEFIYRTVNNVEGIYQIRPRLPVALFEFTDRYVLQDPYGYTTWEGGPRLPTIFINPPWAGYKFLERSSQAEGDRQAAALPFVRYSGYVQDKSPMQREFVPSLSAKHGYTWREIRRPMDRELGVMGGELIVVDLQTNELLGIRRGFARTGFYRNVLGGVNWEATENCPTNPKGFSKDGNFIYWFISKVLKPAN